MSHWSGPSVPSLAIGADGKKHRAVLSGRELIALRHSDSGRSRYAVAAMGHANLLTEVLRKNQLRIAKGGLYGPPLRLAPPMRATESPRNDAPRLLGSALTQVAAAPI